MSHWCPGSYKWDLGTLDIIETKSERIQYCNTTWFWCQWNHFFVDICRHLWHSEVSAFGTSLGFAFAYQLGVWIRTHCASMPSLSRKTSTADVYDWSNGAGMSGIWANRNWTKLKEKIEEEEKEEQQESNNKRQKTTTTPATPATPATPETPAAAAAAPETARPRTTSCIGSDCNRKLPFSCIWLDPSAQSSKDTNLPGPRPFFYFLVSKKTLTSPKLWTLLDDSQKKLHLHIWRREGCGLWLRLDVNDSGWNIENWSKACFENTSALTL